jgi:hypothetical protein
VDQAFQPFIEVKVKMQRKSEKWKKKPKFQKRTNSEAQIQKRQGGCIIAQGHVGPQDAHKWSSTHNQCNAVQKNKLDLREGSKNIKA